MQKVLEEIHDNIGPSLIVKNVTLNVEGETVEILTFGSSVSSILKEIILGTIVTFSDYHDREQVIDINIERDIGHAKVTLKDRSSPISKEDAKEINEGILSRRLPLWFQLERAWIACGGFQSCSSWPCEARADSKFNLMRKEMPSPILSRLPDAKKNTDR